MWYPLSLPDSGIFIDLLRSLARLESEVTGLETREPHVPVVSWLAHHVAVLAYRYSKTCVDGLGIGNEPRNTSNRSEPQTGPQPDDALLLASMKYHIRMPELDYSWY
eukprot:COSAG02_NODE_29122_length_575_cov_2.939076_1_plen_107_part_00